jgi:hypothetical protein
MMTLIIPIEYYNLGSGGRVDYYSGKRIENAVLTLTTIPARTYDVDNPNFGRWTSPSIFLGKELSGNYYVTRIEYFDDPDYKPMTRDPRVKNPVGQFFDSRSTTSPFLILYNFAPNEIQTVSGFGMLGERREGVWGGVNWRIAGQKK